jgi:hypothetical protein
MILGAWSEFLGRSCKRKVSACDGLREEVRTKTEHENLKERVVVTDLSSTYQFCVRNYRHARILCSLGWNLENLS